MKGTYTRHKTNGRGGVRKLEARMTDKQFERRTAKIAMRVGRESAMTRGMVNAFIGMTFWQRLRWVVRGFKRSVVDALPKRVPPQVSDAR